MPQNAQIAVARNVDVSDLQGRRMEFTWTRLEHSLPLPFSANDPLMKFVVRVANLGTMDQEFCKVHGLAADQYSLQIDGKPVLDLAKTN